MQDEGLRKLTKDKVLRVIKGQEKKRDIQLVFFLPLSLSLFLTHTHTHTHTHTNTQEAEGNVLVSFGEEPLLAAGRQAMEA